MKVLVVKLHNKQAAQLENQYPMLDLRIITEDSVSDIASASKRADVIVVMTKFIGHSMLARIDRSKLFLCNGGLTQLRTQLDALAATVPARVAAVPKPQPTFQEEPAMTNTSSSTDFTALKAGKPGEVFQFVKPSKVGLAVFEKNVAASRSYYLRKHGIASIQATKGNVVEVMIERRVTPPVTTLTPPPVQVEVETPTPVDTSKVPDDYMQFWQDVYLQAMRNAPGAQPLIYREQANSAVRTLLATFRK